MRKKTYYTEEPPAFAIEQVQEAGTRLTLRENIAREGRSGARTNYRLYKGAMTAEAVAEGFAGLLAEAKALDAKATAEDVAFPAGQPVGSDGQDDAAGPDRARAARANIGRGRGGADAGPLRRSYERVGGLPAGTAGRPPAGGLPLRRGVAGAAGRMRGWRAPRPARCRGGQGPDDAKMDALGPPAGSRPMPAVGMAMLRP